MKITVTRTPLPGVLLVETPNNRDPRGFFLEAWPVLSERDCHGLSLEQYLRAPAFTYEGM